MKRQRLFSIAFTLSLALLPFTSSDSAAQVPPARRVVADTGIITLGPNQILRVTLALSTRAGGEVISDFVRLAYAEGTCVAGVCTHPVESRIASGPVTLTPGQGASLEIADATFGARVLVSSDSPDVRVLAEVIDATTNQIIVVCIAS
jgi:hypothetical protein